MSESYADAIFRSDPGPDGLYLNVIGLLNAAETMAAELPKDLRVQIAETKQAAIESYQASNEAGTLESIRKSDK